MCLSGSALTSCGGDEPAKDPRLADDGDAAPTVVTATPAELAAGKALPASYIVTFRGAPGSPGLAFASYEAEYRAHFAYLAEGRLTDPRVKDIRFITSVDVGRGTAQSEDFSAPPLLRLAWTREPDEIAASIAQVDFASEEDAKSALADWDAQGALWFAEPNYVSHLSQDNAFNTYKADYADLNYWWLKAINLTQAYESIANRNVAEPGTPSEQDITTNRPIIAVLDSGVDYEHPALKERIWTNTDLNAANCTDDLHGCNTTKARRGKLGDGDVWPYDADGPGQPCTGKDNNCSHGTHVAGIIAADVKWPDNDGRPAAGVCPVCQIMILKIVSKVGKDSGILDSSILAAFKYVTLFKHGTSSAVRVMNASFGKFVRSRSVGLLVRQMKEKDGALLVGAAGNEDTLTMEYPAAFKDAVAVAAVDSRLRKVSFSNFGHWVDIAAPGAALISTVPGGLVDAKSGTSMAAPMVTGVVGLMLARYPDISFQELKNAILDGADPTFYSPDFEEGFNYRNYYPEIPGEDVRVPLLGYGLLNANSAINRTASTGLPIYKDDQRVRPGCATIGGDTLRKGEAWLAMLVLVPLVFAVRVGSSTARRCGNAARRLLASPRRSLRGSGRSRW